MTLFQQLGAFVSRSDNLGLDKLTLFAQAGGKWLAVLLYGDEFAAPANLPRLQQLKADAAARGVKVGIWANFFGSDPEVFAWDIANLVHANDLGPVILDCEASVQGNTLLSKVCLEVRKLLPGRLIGISTNSLNDSAVFNGRIEGVPPAQWKSLRRLGIRVLPQFYSSPSYGWDTNPWTYPPANMAWLNEHGTEDNLCDATYKDKRSVPLSYVHPTLEATGLEGSDLATELAALHAAPGFTKGWSLYLLESTPYEDFGLIANEKGRTFL